MYAGFSGSLGDRLEDGSFYLTVPWESRGRRNSVASSPRYKVRTPTSFERWTLNTKLTANQQQQELTSNSAHRSAGRIARAVFRIGTAFTARGYAVCRCPKSGLDIDDARRKMVRRWFKADVVGPASLSMGRASILVKIHQHIEVSGHVPYRSGKL